MRGTVHRRDVRHDTSTDDSAVQLLLAVTEIQRAFIFERDPEKQFAQVLSCVLNLTNSEYGFIGEVRWDSNGSPWLKTQAIDDIARNEKVREFFKENAQARLEIRNLDNLYGEAIKTGKTVLTNSPAADPRSGGLSDGNPPLKSFLGIPFHVGDKLVGMIGIANREDGYSQELVDWLEPLTTTCATMIAAVHAERERHAADQALRKSEEHFRLIADLTAEVTFEARIDASGILRPVVVRGNLRQVLGVPDWAFVASAWKDHVHPDDLSRIADLIETARSGEMAQQVVRWICPNRETRQLQVSAKTCVSLPGNVQADWVRILGCVVDVTEAMQAEEMLREMVLRKRAILQAVPDLILLMTREGQFIDIWAGDEAGLLAPPEELVGRQHRDFLPSEICDEWDASVIKAESNDEVASFEYTLESGGEARWYEARVVTCGKEKPAFLTVVRDITDRCQAEEAEARQFALLKAISDNSSELIFVKDTERHLLFLNQAVGAMTGRSIEDIIGTTGDSLLPEAISKAIRDVDQQVMESGRAVTYEETLPGVSGDRIYLTSKTPWRNRSGEIVGLVGISQDITDRVEAQQSLQESEARLRAIIEAEPECVKLVARDGTLLEMNSAGIRFAGATSADEVLGKSVFDLIAPEFQSQYREFHEAVCNGRSGVLEMEIVGLQGQRRRMETHAVPLVYGPGGEIGHLAITIDVTDARKTEAVVAQQHAQLLHVSRLSSLGQMAGSISHEITQPLSAISNYAATCRLLLKQTKPSLQAFARHIESIAQQAHRAGDTLDRIRSFIRGTETQKQRCHIGEVIHGALELMKADLRNRQAHVAVHAPAQLSAVWADRVQIQQVITNLVSNSCDAMQQSPMSERKIDIVCRQEADHVVIAVEDSGPGLDDLSQDKLFEPFSSSKSDGMGLGLAICRDIVSAHGGTITASNSPHRGALFQFTLPVEKEPNDV